MSSRLDEWERAERERSAAEAAGIDPETLLANPDNVARYIDPPRDTEQPLEYAFHLLGDVRGKTVLEYGCGDGLNTILLAHRNARQIVSLDISPDLVRIARHRLQVNRRTDGVQFIVGSAHEMPLEDKSVDVVFGIAILHHLDLRLAAAEIKRVLRPGGRAIFNEPVRNSKLLKAARRLVPYSRSPEVSPYERPLTDAELREFATGFSSYHSRAFLLPTTALAEMIPPIRRFARRFYRADTALLRRFPALGHYAGVRVVAMTR